MMTNTFKFKSFTEYISDINVRSYAFYNLGHHNEELPEENESYFHQALRHWCTLNLTDDFVGFSKKYEQTATLPQLILEKDTIVTEVIVNIRKCRKVSLRPFLEVLIALAKDLRDDFYIFFENVMENLISVCNSNDPEVIEWIFFSLAGLFKVLKTFLKRDFVMIFNKLFLLLQPSKQPPYIVNFLAECIAYLARGLKDPEKLISTLMMSIKSNSACNEEIGGKIIMETVRGVKRQFNSCTDDLFKLIVRKFVDDGFEETEILVTITTHSLLEIMRTIQPDNMRFFVQILTKFTSSSEGKPSQRFLEIISKLIHCICEYKSGYYICPDLVVPLILKIVDEVDTKQINTLMTISNLASTVLLAKSARLSQVDSSRLMRKVSSCVNFEVLTHFAMSVLDHDQFEVDVLPYIFTRFDVAYTVSTINALAKIALNKESSKKIVLPPSLSKKILDAIEAYHPGKGELDAEIFILIMYALPLIDLMDSGRLNIILKIHILDICKHINSDNSNSPDTNKEIYVLYLVVEFLVRSGTDMRDLFDQIIETILPHCRSGCYTCPLKILSSLVGSSKSNKINNLYERLHECLSDNLCSTNRITRRLSARVLYESTLNKDDSLAYKIMLEVEEIDAGVPTYREQLLILRRLSTQSELFFKIKDERTKVDCLKFFLGLLFHNFTLLWEEALNLIEEYSQKLRPLAFWNVLNRQLEYLAERCVNQQNGRDGNLYYNHHFANETVNQNYEYKFENHSKTNFISNRMLLWKSVPKYNQATESNGCKLIDLFLKFVQNEYKSQSSRKPQTWNLLKTENEELATESDVDSDSVLVPKKRRKTKLTFSQEIKNTLIIKLESLSKLNGASKYLRRSDLRKVFTLLLRDTDTCVQKLALDCILIFNEESIIPYKVNLYNIIDDRKITAELMKFRLDKETSCIREEHRIVLIPIIFDILFGKLRARGSSKQINVQARRTLIVKYISGCEINEILSLLSLFFECYGNILDESISNIPTIVSESMKLNRVVTAKKLSSSINLVELLMEYFGYKIYDGVITHIIKILIATGSICNVVLKNVELVKVNFVNMYGAIKSVCLLNFVKVFEQLHEYEWREEELNALYNVFIWSSIEKLADNCIDSPTPIIRLFSVWCHNSKHNHLLLKRHPDTQRQSLTFMLDIFRIAKAKEAVYDFILDAVEQLLLYEDENIRKIIEPYFSIILDRYITFFEKRDNLKTPLRNRDMNILLMICAIINQDALCDKILKIFLPVLLRIAKNSSNNEYFSGFLKIIEQVLSTMNGPEKFIPKIVALFEHITDIGSRRSICELLRKIEYKVVGHQNNVKGLSSVASQLNAVDRRWFDQADYEKRLRALRNVTEKLKKGELSFEIGLTVVYNCFYFLKNERDIGMRNSCNDYLRQIIPSLIKTFTDDKKLLNLFVNDVVLYTLKDLLRKNDDSIITDAVQLLGHLVRTCSDMHYIFSELARLCDSTDPELDFFENLTHLQTHRHSRALLKFVNLTENGNVFCANTLTRIILPLCTRYLYNEKFVKKHTIVDAAIEAVGAICRLLPWPQYYSILRYYLSKMRYKTEFHKQSLRILMVVLDAFHFDLSKGKSDNREMLEKPERSFQITDNVEKSTSLTLEFETPSLKSMNKIDLRTRNCDTVLPPTTAKHVIHVFSSVLIPSLNNSITDLSEHEASHKLIKKKINAKRESDETLRVPLALAIVKLLQKLPAEIFSTHISGVLMKVCAFLKSPLKSVRMFTRDVLKKIILSLGPKYLSTILDPLFSLLTRGFQVHVLAVTIHGILDVIKEGLTPVDIEPCLNTILKITLNDIFGEVADEKEVYKIGQRTPEAKTSTKSYLVLNIVSQNIKSDCLIDMMGLFKEHLSQIHSKKLISKINICFQKIAHGLVENKNIIPKDILSFIYGLVYDNLDNILKCENFPIQQKVTTKNHQDCLIMQYDEKKRCNLEHTTKNRMQKSFPLFVEFALKLLHLMIKRRKVSGPIYEQFLNPLVPMLVDSLENSAVRISILSTNCINSLLKSEHNLEKIKKFAPKIKEIIFRSLHKYFSTNISLNDENYALVKSTFKSLIVIVRKYDYCNLNSNDLNQLFYYIDQYINSTENSSIGFSLLKSILSRKLNLPEIHDFMKNLCDVAITSNSEKVKEESRSILLFYIIGCKRSKNVNNIFKFFVNHLKYETPSGRLSAIAFLQLLTKKLKLIRFKKRSEFLFISLSTRLVNEELPECRVAVAECIEAILVNLDEDTVSRLLDLTLLMFDCDRPPVREMAAMLCSRFIETKKPNFYENAKAICVKLIPRYNAYEFVKEGKYVLLSTIIKNNNKNINQPSAHELIQVGNCIVKIHETYPKLFEEKDLFGLIDQLAYNSQELLNYHHEWVRLNSVKILNRILRHYDYGLVKKILQGLSENVTGRSFIYSYPKDDIRSMCLDMCAQLKPNAITIEFSNEIIDVLLRLAQMINLTPPNECDISLLWLVRRLQYIAYAEIVKTPQIFLLRSSVFKWIERLLPLIDKVLLQHILPELMKILQRDLTEDNANTDKQVNAIAVRICSRIRKLVNDESYDNMWAKIQRSILMKKARKKKLIAQEKVLNPLKAARRKRSRIESKKLTKRKKICHLPRINYNSKIQ